MNHAEDRLHPNVVAIIPARYASLRLPGKPLLDICGRALILRVLDCVRAARRISRAIVATDDTRIYDAVCAAGGDVVMTRSNHQSGSDRLAEVAQALTEVETIVNVQGDEPLISVETIDRAVDELHKDADAMIVTTCEAMTRAEDVLSPDVVKVVTDERGRALYFSRAPIPYPRDIVRRHRTLEAALHAEPSVLKTFRKHTGLYVYRRRFLLEYTGWRPSALEQTESLEQLRALEHGACIKVIESSAPSIGVDTPEDLARVRHIFQQMSDVRC